MKLSKECSKTEQYTPTHNTHPLRGPTGVSTQWLSVGRPIEVSPFYRLLVLLLIYLDRPTGSVAWLATSRVALRV